MNLQLSVKTDKKSQITDGKDHLIECQIDLEESKDTEATTTGEKSNQSNSQKTGS